MPRLLSTARDLRRRRARERQHLFAAEGVRTAEELLASPIAVRGLLASAGAADAERPARLLADAAARGIDVVVVSDAEFATASDTETSQGVLGIAEVPRRRLDDVEPDGDAPILLLDGVQDPGNVGTIVRTAAALGARATLALPGTVDLWNAKVVRSAMGSLFRHLALATTWSDFDTFRARHALDVWATDAAGDPLGAAPAAGRLAIAVSNEGAGASPELRARARRLVALRISPDVESLNVAVAAGIALYTLSRAP